MNQFVSDFVCEGPHEIGMSLEKWEMKLIGILNEIVDFSYKPIPVLPENLQRFSRESPRSEPGHEPPIGHLALGSLKKRLNQRIDMGFGLFR